MIMGSLAILLINKGLVYGAGMSGIGLNPVTVLTSGILGFPGVAVLYGIYFYKML
jgi:inhibitor of the pro-sigma K processing machinery